MFILGEEDEEAEGEEGEDEEEDAQVIINYYSYFSNTRKTVFLLQHPSCFL